MKPEVQATAAAEKTNYPQRELLLDCVQNGLHHLLCQRRGNRIADLSDAITPASAEFVSAWETLQRGHLYGS
jgi:hypothetical protein